MCHDIYIYMYNDNRFYCYDNIEISSDYYSKISLLENRSHIKNERILHDKKKREIKSMN